MGGIVGAFTGSLIVAVIASAQVERSSGQRGRVTPDHVRLHHQSGAGLGSITLSRMTATRDQLIRDARRYVEAGERLVAGVTSLNAMNREALDDLSNDMSLTESCRIRDSATLSRTVAELLDDFERCRRETRSSTAAVLREEGMTIAEVGKAFGVSHQLASRFAKGRHGDDGQASVDVGDGRSYSGQPQTQSAESA